MKRTGEAGMELQSQVCCAGSATPVSQHDHAGNLLERHGIMRCSALKRRGGNPATIARLAERSVVFQPSRGLYELLGSEVQAAHSLAEVVARRRD